MKSVFPLLAAAALPAQPFAVHADVIFHESFEAPAVTGRTPCAAGGDPSQPDPAKPGAAPAWGRFEDRPDLGGECGRVVAGLTNRMARTGRQALFVEAALRDAPFLGAFFVTRPIAIEGGACYRACLWGCNDPERPLPCTDAAARLFLKIQVDFFADDGKTAVGESQYLLQPLPGARGCPPRFLPARWQPIGLRFAAPAQARAMVLSFRFLSRAEKGAVAGAIYWDDLTVETVPAELPAPRLPPAEK